MLICLGDFSIISVLVYLSLSYLFLYFWAIDSGIVAQNACLDTALPEPDVSSDMKFPYLSNIWKPDRVDCLDSSFATSGICTDRSSTFDPFTDTNLFAFPQPSSFSQQSNIAYDDAAILQAVVAGGDLPPQNESETAISCNSSFFSNLIPPSMCKNMEGELTSAFQNTVLQPNINTSTSADMNVNSLEERLTPIVTTPNVAVQNVGLDESREKDSQITRSGPSAESGNCYFNCRQKFYFSVFQRYTYLI